MEMYFTVETHKKLEAQYVECFYLQFVVDCLINHELEVENFQKAVDILSQVWEKTVIVGYLVYWWAVPVGKAYKPPNPDPVWVEIDPGWVKIVKCQNKSCCSPFVSNGEQQDLSWMSENHPPTFHSISSHLRVLRECLQSNRTVSIL